MKTFLRLLRMALAYKWWMLLASLLGFLTVGSSVGLMMTSAYIISKAALHPSVAVLQVAIVGVRFFGVSRGIFRYLERLVSHEVTFRLLAKFRVWFYKAVEPLAPAGLQKFRSGDLLARVVSDVENLEHIYVRVLAPPIVAFFISILMWFLLGMFNPIFSLILLTAFVGVGTLLPILARTLSSSIGQQIINAHSQLSVAAIDGIQGMAELLAFGQATRHFERFGNLNQKLVNLQKKMTSVTGIHESLMNLAINLTVTAMLLAAIPQVTTSALNGVYLAVLILGTMAAFEAIVPLPTATQFLDQSLSSARRLFEITDSPPVIREPDMSSPQAQDFSIEFRNLTFRYPGSEKPVLRNLSFTVPQAKRVAVVGPSGAGKTTLVNLLLRFWSFSEGDIRLGENSINAYQSDVVRNFIAFVSQQTYLFNGTIEENLKLANLQATQNEIEKAAREAEIHDFILTLPNGYKTHVGEQGLQLSGGERQRLALARALLKRSPILILDEPTANLDALTEQKILKTLWKISKNRTTILITHRLSGLENVDRIYLLRAGQIVEDGTHTELLQRNRIYARMWQIQNDFAKFEWLEQRK